MLKPLRQLVSFKEPAAEPAVEESSQATKGWEDDGRNLGWCCGFDSDKYLKMRYDEIFEINMRMSSMSSSKNEGCDITKKMVLWSQRSCAVARHAAVLAHVVSGRATNSGEQCCWLNKGRSRFEGLPFKPRSVLDGSEGLKLAIFESHKVCKYSTHMSQEYIHVPAPFRLDHWMLMDASLL